MASSTQHRLIEPNDLSQDQNNAKWHIIDLNPMHVFEHNHIPGAIHLEYDDLVTQKPPVLGYLPNENVLADTLSELGLTPDMAVVAYDDGGGAKACRLLWTLDAVGHTGERALLNGGLAAWQGTNASTSAHHPVTPSHYAPRLTNHVVVDKQYVLEHLNDPQIQLLDTRTIGEFNGAIARAARGGHIPSAVNLDWQKTLDIKNHRRLLPTATLRQLYEELGVTPDKEIICYCHTHHRSSHTYFVLKWLGYPHVKAYPGSWSEWGNCDDTPIT